MPEITFNHPLLQNWQIVIMVTRMILRVTKIQLIIIRLIANQTRVVLKKSLQILIQNQKMFSF